MTSKLEKAVVSLKEKDASIKDLNGLCLKFETQLKKQDELLKMFAEKKGYKPSKWEDLRKTIFRYYKWCLWAKGNYSDSISVRFYEGKQL